MASLNRVKPKEEIFVLEYLIDLNAAHAAVRAGYPKNLGVKLLRKASVRQEVEKAMAARSVRVGMTADRVLEQLGLLLMGDVSMLYHSDGRMKTPDEMTPDEAKLVVGVRTKRALEIGADGKPAPVEITEYKLVDKTAVLNMAMRHFGLFKDTLTVDVTSLAQRMQAAQARVGAGIEVLKPDTPVLASDAEVVGYEIDGVMYDVDGNEIISERAEDYI